MTLSFLEIMFFLIMTIYAQPLKRIEKNFSTLSGMNNNTDFGDLFNKTLDTFKNLNQTKFNMSKYINLSDIFREYGLNITDIKNRKKNITKVRKPILPNPPNNSTARKMPLWVVPLARGFQI